MLGQCGAGVYIKAAVKQKLRRFKGLKGVCCVWGGGPISLGII